MSLLLKPNVAKYSLILEIYHIISLHPPLRLPLKVSIARIRYQIVCGLRHPFIHESTLFNDIKKVQARFFR
jgi:hypothetical protein